MKKMNNSFTWQIKNEYDGNTDEGEICLYGEVVSHAPRDFWTGEKIDDVCISPEGFAEALGELKGKSKVTVKLNSVGGDLFVGIAIRNQLRSLGARVHVIVEGLAASAGSIIACAGDTVSMYAGSMIMIHGAKVGLADYFDIYELKKIENRVKSCNESIVAIYAEKTGLSAEKLHNMIDKETWFVGAQAVDAGFADEVIDGDVKLQFVASADHKMIVGENGIGVIADKYFLPERVREKLDMITQSEERAEEESGATAADGRMKDAMQNKISDMKGGEDMEIKSAEELKKAFPDLCNSIIENAIKENAEKAITAERERIKAIDDIAFKIGDKALIEKAKFESGKTAADLLMEDALAEKDRNAKRLAALDDDAVKTAAVAAAPVNPEKDLKAATKEMSIADRIKAGQEEAEKLLKGAN